MAPQHVTIGESEFESGQLPTDEGHINYYVRNTGGPHLILIPGSFNDRRALEGIIRNLNEGIGVTIPEIRGHGGSWPPPENGSIELFARDVISVADEIGLREFFIGGHSIGGMISLEVGKLVPERVRGIIAIEGWTNSRASKDAFGNSHWTTMPPEIEARRMEIRKSVTERWDDTQRKGFAQIWKRWDGSSFLADTCIPILEIWGDRGRRRPSLEDLHIPDRENIQVKWIANASHPLPLEAPKEVAKAINGFIDMLR